MMSIITKDNSSDKMFPLINISPDKLLNNSENSCSSVSTNGSENKDKTTKMQKIDGYPEFDETLIVTENNKNYNMKETNSLVLEEEKGKSCVSSAKKEEMINNLINVNEQKEKKNEKKDILIEERDKIKSNNQTISDKSNNISHLDGILKKKEKETNLLKKHPLMDKNEFSSEMFETQKIGFPNIGNTCYMNSFLQILLHTPGFLNELKKERKENCDLIDNLISLSEEPHNKKYLKNIKNIMGQIKDSYGKKNYQSDSQEFGIDLINEIINIIKGDLSFSDENDYEENQITSANIGPIKKTKFEKYIDKYYNEKNEISLEKMFQFHESKLEIESTANDEITKINKIKFETCINIDLDLQEYKKTDLMELLGSKYNVFSNSTNDIILNVNDNYKYLNENKDLKKKVSKNNDNNEKKNQKTWIDILIDFIKYLDCFGLFKSCINDKEEDKDIEENKEDYINLTKLASLPKILIISINRAFLGKNFNDNIISYKERLDVKKFIDKDILKKEKTKYRLYAVNECLAHKKESGHYYSYIKINKIWYKFNDDKPVLEESPNLSSKYVVGLYYIKDE